MYHLASEDGVVPSNKDTSRSTNRRGKLKFIEMLWRQFLDEGVIKVISFCLLDAEHCTRTLLYFLLDRIAFIFRIETTNIPV